MDLTLKVTTEALKEQAEKVEDWTQKLQLKYEAIQDMIAKTNGYWIGEAGDQHRKAFEEKKEDMDRIIGRFQEQPTKLLQMAGVYETAETQSKEEAEMLDPDVII